MAIMGVKQELQERLIELNNKYIDVINLKDEIWNYHPSNPKFINPITLFEKLKSEIMDIEREINDLTFKINSLN
jgi:hypothetical protein